MIIILFFVVSSILIFWNSEKLDPRQKIPQAKKALPIFGHIWLGFVKREELYKVLTEDVLTPLQQISEDIVCFFLGTCKIYACLDPEDGYLVINSSLERDVSFNFLKPVCGRANSLATADVSIWKVHRKLLNPTMNESVLNTYLTEFNNQSRQLIQLMEQQLNNEFFDPLPYLRQIVLQSVCATIMGVKENKLLVEEYGTISDIISSTITKKRETFFYCYDFLYNWSSLKKKEDETFLRIQKLTNKVIKEREAVMQDRKMNDINSSRSKSFLDLLLEMKENGVFTESEIQQEVNNFMAASFDTTYQTLGTILLTIGSYPTVQHKIVEELQAVFNKSRSNVEQQDLSQLKYLEATIKETLRLYPTVLAIGRTLEQDLNLKKHTLLAGSRCCVSIYHVGRHRVWGTDAEQFRPERWLDGSLPRLAGAFASFGLGKRNCIGSNFAMMLMKTVLCHVVRAYRISGDITELVRNLDIVISPASGHHISLQRRE